MDGASDEFFSGAGFAENADAGFAGSDAIDLGQEFFHRWARADEFMLAEAVAQFAVFIFEAGKFQSVFDGEQQLVCAERLFQKIECAKARGFDRHFDIGLAGDQHDGRLHAGFFQFFEKVHAAFAGHDHVRKDQVEMLGAHKFHGSSRVVADGGFVACEAKGSGKRRQRVGIVVDEEEMRFAWHGGPFGGYGLQHQIQGARLGRRPLHISQTRWRRVRKAIPRALIRILA